MEAPTDGTIRLPVVLRFVDLATDALAGAREEIDALNVYPVPDGDTGTNMYLTVSAARDALREVALGDPSADLIAGLRAFRRGALLGARGNSGVILSEMLGAFAQRVAARKPGDRNATVMANAMTGACEASYAAVGDPVEGTILTVARAAADAAAARAGDPGARARDVVAAAAESAREALARTPDQLQVLRDAGVVDAGGRGLSVILDAAETVLTGRRPMPVTSPIGRPSIPVPLPTGDLTEDGPAYEVMYLLDAEDDRIPELKQALAPLGDSLVVVGGDRLFNVHVHVHDVGAAIEAGIRAGRPYRVRVTHFAEQAAQARQQTAERRGRRIVAVAAGPGLASLFAEAGAVVVEGAPGRRPSTGQILEAITTCGAEEVVVLPNDPDSVRAAEVAARTAESDEKLAVAVIPTRAQVQGLAALAVHEPARTFQQDVLEMTATARAARHGAVTVAARRAMTMAGPCEPGDVLGVVEADFAVIGDDLYAVATEVLDRLLGGGGELVTLVTGQGDHAGLARRCAAHVEQHHLHADVVIYHGGQERYPLLISVE
ncbi:MAG TPA: DAK2 domain-containing protein [Nocardioides sp.]|nr:DAK2 domain-containing protein [Nocardioides sp.]